MKFTKEDARKELMSKIPNKGQTLQLSERSINEMLDTLMPLIANDETELTDFVEKVLPTFRTADGNVKNDISVGIKEYKDANPIQEPQKQKPTQTKEGEDEAMKALREQLEAMQKRLNDADAEKKQTETRRGFMSKVKEKGVKDSEWVKSYVSELTIGENFDVEARVDACVKLYNKTKAASGGDDTNPDTAGGGGKDGDKYVANTISQAGELAKSRRLG